MPSLVYTRPYLYPKQEAAIFTPKRFAGIEASTKSGKTQGSIAWILEKAFLGKPGQNRWWVAPVSSQALIAYNRVKSGLPQGSFEAYASPTPRIELLIGNTLSFKSGDQPDSLYGEDVCDCVIDEASRCKPESYHAVISTLTATKGNLRAIGNVKGRKNWFYHFCRRLERGDEPNGNYARITYRDAIEAGVLDPESVEEERRALPEMVFKELFEAVAADDEGNPFGLDHIAACTKRLSDAPPVVFGIDLAKKQDWFVIIGLDANGCVCVFQRWQGIPWRESIRRVWSIVGEDLPALVDSTGLGDPVLEELQVEHGNFRGFHFTGTSKQRLMEGLAVSIQSREISYPPGPIANELESFEYQYTPTGVRYAAAEGYNDDCVMALGLARNQWTENNPGATMMTYIRGEIERAQTAVAEREQLEALPVGEAFVRELSVMTREEQHFNELSELYNETAKGFQRAAKPCAGCGKPLTGNSRVSDGVFVWHPECVGFGVRR